MSVLLLHLLNHKMLSEYILIVSFTAQNTVKETTTVKLAGHVQHSNAP